MKYENLKYFTENFQDFINRGQHHLNPSMVKKLKFDFQPTFGNVVDNFNKEKDEGLSRNHDYMDRFYSYFCDDDFKTNIIENKIEGKIENNIFWTMVDSDLDYIINEFELRLKEYGDKLYTIVPVITNCNLILKKNEKYYKQFERIVNMTFKPFDGDECNICDIWEETNYLDMSKTTYDNLDKTDIFNIRTLVSDKKICVSYPNMFGLFKYALSVFTNPDKIRIEINVSDIFDRVALITFAWVPISYKMMDYEFIKDCIRQDFSSKR